MSATLQKNTEQINWYGCYTLTAREIKRFLRVYNQTVIAPAVSALIFLSVFVLALGEQNHKVGNIDFIHFMGSGLIIMSIVQNAFANTSSSLIMSRVIGYITDILTPPMGGIEIVLALSAGALARGLIVGATVWLCLLPFVSFSFHAPLLLIFFAVSSSLLYLILSVVLEFLAIFIRITSNSSDRFFSENGFKRIL